MFLSIGSVIIDDIVLPDGRTWMGVLGGGATHAAMGMRVWSDQVGMVASIGHDFPEADYGELSQAFDLRGLQRRAAPTPRAWQLFESDGRRTEIFRTDLDEFIALSPKPDELPAAYAGAAGVHLECGAPHPFREWVARLRADGCPLVLWEPWDSFCRPENRALFRDLAASVDVASPNLLEARRLTGLSNPSAVVAALLDDGAPVVALRMGETGSLVAGRQGQVLAVPPAAVGKIVDVTGAGNGYCGGFLVGWDKTGDLAQAGRYAAVSASFALEQFGALYSLQGLAARAERRLKGLLASR